MTQSNIRLPNFTVLASAPASGVLPSILMPTNRRAKVKAVWFSLTTSATVANREFQLSLLDDSAGVVFSVGNGLLVPASQSVQWWYGANYGQATQNYVLGSGSQQWQGLGFDWPLEAGWSITMTAINYQSNDDSVLRVLAELDVA